MLFAYSNASASLSTSMSVLIPSFPDITFILESLIIIFSPALIPLFKALISICVFNIHNSFLALIPVELDPIPVTINLPLPLIVRDDFFATITASSALILGGGFDRLKGGVGLGREYLKGQGKSVTGEQLGDFHGIYLTKWEIY